MDALLLMLLLIPWVGLLWAAAVWGRYTRR